MWITDFPASPFPSSHKSFQSAALHALLVDHKCADIVQEIRDKLLVTLKQLSPIIVPIPWNDHILECLSSVSSYIKVCWLKTVCGAWCTSVRLHTVQGRGCIFGCTDTKDELFHYLQCPVLWPIARDCLRIQEASILVLHRLNIYEPSTSKLKRLACCHALYHVCVNVMMLSVSNQMAWPMRLILYRTGLQRMCVFACIY